MRTVLILSSVLCLLSSLSAQESFLGNVKPIHTIDCVKTKPLSEYPEGSSRIETILGKPCRVLPKVKDKPSYMVYRIGRGKNLKPGQTYVLVIEYPEDKPRSYHICNWGCETVRGFATGSAVGDILKGKYTNHNPESIQYPLAGEYRKWEQVFFLHDRFPEIKRPRGKGERPLTPGEGFNVIIAQPEAKNAPLSNGPAVRSVSLYPIRDISRLYPEINYPPEGLPRRHLFFREEMADGVINYGHSKADQDPKLRGVTDRTAWYEYKVKLSKFLGMNTFCKDLLEFGHNQGWDSKMPGKGGSDWYNQSSDPKLWQNILKMLGKYDMDVLPYYEYAGSIGQNRELALGSQRRCMTLQGGKDYTHITWVHKTNADLADPAFLEDAKRLLDYTIGRHKNKVNFLGAWFRPRPEANPISFNDTDLAIFAREENRGASVTRTQLQHNSDLLVKYYMWWFGKRKAFLEALSDHLRKSVSPDAFILYTTDSSEPGASLTSQLTGQGQKDSWKWKSVIVTDQPAVWEKILSSPEYTADKRYEFFRVIGLDRVLQNNMHGQRLLMPGGTWGKWEWHHACPQADPQNYQDSDKVLFSYTFNRLYTVSNEDAFNIFRNKRGLAIVRHYPLNENEMNDGKNDILGYFVSDVERAGPYCMAAEARAMAYGDPRYIGYLTGNSFSRGFPEYVRNFNRAFLALPALPSGMVEGASSDPEVIVRMIQTPKDGVYLAAVNTALTSKKSVRINLPGKGVVIDPVSGDLLNPLIKFGRATLDFYPCQLRVIWIK